MQVLAACTCSIHVSKEPARMVSTNSTLISLVFLFTNWRFFSLSRKQSITLSYHGTQNPASLLWNRLERGRDGSSYRDRRAERLHLRRYGQLSDGVRRETDGRWNYGGSQVWHQKKRAFCTCIFFSFFSYFRFRQIDLLTMLRYKLNSRQSGLTIRAKSPSILTKTLRDR